MTADRGTIGRHRDSATLDPLLAVRVHGAAAALDDGVLATVDPVVGSALRLARDHGAPMGPVVRAATAAAAQRRALADDVAAAVAPARTVARTLVGLPVVAVPVLGTIAGADLVGFYLGDPVGRGLGIVVVALVALGAAWMHVLVAAVGRPRPGPGPAWPFAVAAVLALVVVGVVPGLLLAIVAIVRRHRVGGPAPSDPHLPEAVDLAAVAVAAGHDLSTALRIAADHLAAALPTVDTTPLARHLRALGLGLVLDPPDPHRPDHDDASVAPLAAVVRALATSGTPGVDVLRDLAGRLRDDRARRDREDAARLPARLTFPTALVLVPATVLAIGAPIVVEGLAGVTGT